MIGTVANIFRIQDLRNKILFTVALLAIYRIGFHIQIPGFDQAAMRAMAETRDTTNPLGRAMDYLQIFTGGTMSQSSLFGLGIMPYISASIIFQLLGDSGALSGEAAEGRPGGLQEDPGVHPLR